MYMKTKLYKTDENADLDGESPNIDIELDAELEAAIKEFDCVLEEFKRAGSQDCSSIHDNQGE